MSTTWRYILSLLGPGSLWGRTREELLHAIERARQDGQTDAAAHLEGMLRSRDEVCFDTPKPYRPARPEIRLRELPR